MNHDLSVPSMTDAEIYRSSSTKLTLLIPKSRSKNHALALKFASLIESFQTYVEGQLFTICYVDLKTPRDCEVAVKIINLAGNWKGFSAIFKGRTLSNFLLSYKVLPCITEAMQCVNTKAHCSKVVRGNAYIKNYHFVDYQICDFELILPCRIAGYGFYEPALNIPVNEQYQAYAVEMDVHWCPFFDISAIEILDINPSQSSTSQLSTL